MAFIGFFAFLVFGMAGWRGSSELFLPLPSTIVALAIGCRSAIGFWLTLKSLGMTEKE